VLVIQLREVGALRFTRHREPDVLGVGFSRR